MADNDQARMAPNRLASLIDGWLDGDLSRDDISEMESLLLESAHARQEFWRRAAFHGHLHEAARMKFATLPIEASVGHRLRARTRWRGFLQASGPWLAGSLLLATVAAGFGAGAASLALAYSEKTAEMIAPMLLMHFESFESSTDPETNYIPDRIDVWGGDETMVIQGAESGGISPKSGTSMLRFVSSHPATESYQANASEIWRFIDVAALRKEVGSESFDVEFSAWFNSVAQTAGHRPQGGLSIVATNVPPAEWDNSLWEETSPFDHRQTVAWRQPLATAAAKKRLDDDPSSWQPVTAILAVPQEAKYLLLHCYVVDYAAAAPDEDRFPGAYVDDIEVRVAGSNRYGVGKTSVSPTSAP